ncbi:MAG TPA: hypothetical protein VGQ42_11745 [Candidatus Dormibacteraeota bacterium]|jgi:hypothetical protein|nr:hypothetical protein [Candidatus Dormibacteraeota bacterium]
MSRENRRKVSAPGATAVVERPAPRPLNSDGQTGGGTISWRHCLIGLVVGELTLLVLSDGGLALANVAFGSDGRNRLDGGVVGMATFLAVLTGAFLAARMAGRFELYQGTAVAVGFIIVGALFEFGNEASAVHTSLNGTNHTLIDLGPMNMGGLISGDFLALVGGSIGALLARRRAGNP